MSENSYDPKSVTILIVDDHDLIRKSIIKTLSKKKFEKFLEAPNGQEAIQIINENNIDLIFCDLYMNRGDGFDVLSYVRNRSTNDDIPLIIVTGEAGKDDIVKVVDLGADDYMLKPFQTEELERKTHKALIKYYNPNPLLHHIRAAERCILDEIYDEAFDHLKKAKKIDPRSARANHVLAIYFESINDLPKAVETLKENIRDNKTYLKNYTTLSDIFLKRGDLKEAIKYMTSELDLNPKNVRRQIKLAQLLHKEKKFQEAIEHYRLALVENPKAKAALYGMGLSHAESDNLEKAVYYFKRARRAYPEYTKPLEAIVKYGIDFDKAKASEFVLLDEKKNNPRRLDTYIVLAKFYVQIAEPDKGIDILEDGLRKFPENVDFISLKAKIEIQQKDYKKAIETLRQLLQLHPSAQTMVLLSEVYHEILDFKNAIKLMEKLLKSPKTAPVGMSRIAKSLASDRQLVRAYFCHLKTLQLGNRSPDIREETVKLREIILSKRIKVTNKTKSDQDKAS